MRGHPMNEGPKQTWVRAPAPGQDGQSVVSGNDLIGIREVMSKVGVSRATLFRMLRARTFVAPLDIGVRRSLWRRNDVDQWLTSRDTREPMSGGSTWCSML